MNVGPSSFSSPRASRSSGGRDQPGLSCGGLNKAIRYWLLSHRQEQTDVPLSPAQAWPRVGSTPSHPPTTPRQLLSMAPLGRVSTQG